MKYCACCSKPIPKGRRLYCSDECMNDEGTRRWKEKYGNTERQKEARKREERMKDTNIWNHDYAEIQKQKTLNLLGPIRIEDYK